MRLEKDIEQFQHKFSITSIQRGIKSLQEYRRNVLNVNTIK